MKVLLVAPRTNLLLVDQEIRRVERSGLEVETLDGYVDLVRLADEVDRQPYDVLWFATHGSPDGILLSDGILKSEELSQMVRGRFSLIVLNTCESIQTAQMLQNETQGEAEIIATIQSVPDKEAFLTGTFFARALAQTQDSAAAYNIARPGNNRTYIRLAGNGKKK